MAISPAPTYTVSCHSHAVAVGFSGRTCRGQTWPLQGEPDYPPQNAAGMGRGWPVLLTRCLPDHHTHIRCAGPHPAYQTEE